MYQYGVCITMRYIKVTSAPLFVYPFNFFTIISVWKFTSCLPLLHNLLLFMLWSTTTWMITDKMAISISLSSTSIDIQNGGCSRQFPIQPSLLRINRFGACFSNFFLQCHFPLPITVDDFPTFLFHCLHHNYIEFLHIIIFLCICQPDDGWAQLNSLNIFFLHLPPLPNTFNMAIALPLRLAYTYFPTALFSRSLFQYVSSALINFYFA